MKKPTRPADEEARQRELDATCLLDSPDEPAFDAVTRAVASILDVPIALVSLVDRERQWFKSRHGLSARETPRDLSFCGHVVGDARPLVVHDARLDERFADNPLVVGEPFVIFYAGFPLTTPTGRILGTLCAIDRKPRVLAPREASFLSAMASQVASFIELRTHARIHEEQMRELAESTLAAVLGVGSDGTIRWASWRACDLLGVGKDALVGRTMGSLFCDSSDYSELSAALDEAGSVRRREVRLRGPDGGVRPAIIDADQRLWSREGTYRRYVLSDASEEAARVRTTESLVTLFDHSRDLICTADGRLFLDHLNPSWERVLGYGPTELREHSLLWWVHPDDVANTQRVIRELFDTSVFDASGSVVDFEHRLRSKTGSYRHVSWVLTVHRGTLLATGRDVTEQVAAHARVEFNNRLLRLVTEAQSEFITPGTSVLDWWKRVLDGLLAATESEYGFIGTVESDGQGRYLKTKAITDISWNDETKALFRRQSEQGMVFRNLKTLFGRVIVEQQSIVSNDVEHDPRAGGRPPGHPPLKSFLGLACGVGDNLVGMVGLANRKGGYDPTLVSDLSVAAVFIESVLNQLRSSARSSAAEARLNAVIDSTVDAIVTTDEPGRILSVNAAFEKIFGYGRDEAVGSEIAIVMADSQRDAEHGLGSIAAAPRPDGAVSGRRILGRRKDGSTVPIELTLTEFFLDEVRYRTAILRDVSARVVTERALRDAAAQLSNALEIARAGHWQYDVASDEFVFNDSFFRIFGTSVAEVGSYRLSSSEYASRFVHPDDAAIVGKEVRAALEARDPKYSRQVEHRFLYADGSIGFMAVRFFVVTDAEGRVTTIYGVDQDITERRQQAMDLARMQAQQQITAELARKVDELDRSRLLSALTSECVELVQRCISISEGVDVIARFVERMYPDANVALYGQDDDGSADLVLRQHRRRFGDMEDPAVIEPSACWAARTRRSYAVWRGGTHIPCAHSPRNNSVLSMCAPLLSLDRMVGLISVALPRLEEDGGPDEESINGRVAHFGAAVQSLSGALSSISLRESLQRLALIDELTGLPNRRAFAAAAQRILARRRRTHEAIAVAMVDIDHFKRINDSWGHDEGDRVLKRLSEVMTSFFRADDVVGRLGGEEFALVMSGATSTDTQRRLEEFHRRVRELCASKGDPVTVSIGYVHSDQLPSSSLDDLLREADGALYAAKRGGRDRVVRGPAPPN